MLTKESVMSKLYIVLETSFEYNDEYYYTNTDAGFPVKVFKNREDAENCQMDYNLKKLQTENIGSYDQNGLLEQREDQLNELGCTINDYELVFPKKLTKHVAKKILKLFNINFYTVREVEE